MNSTKFQNATLLTFILCLVLALMVPTVNATNAQKDFTIDAKINTQKLNDADKLKVVATANGDTQVKNLTGNDLKSKSSTVSFRFNQKNNIVSVGKRDEYAVCAYAISVSNEMKS